MKPLRCPLPEKPPPPELVFLTRGIAVIDHLRLQLLQAVELEAEPEGASGPEGEGRDRRTS